MDRAFTMPPLSHGMKWFVVLLASLVLASPASAAPKKKIYSILEAGAVGDAKTDCTKAIQATIDRCAGVGGGIIVVPAGSYLISPLVLKSKITLRLEKDSRLIGPGAFDKYPQDFEYPGHLKPSLLSGSKLHDVGIVGEGIIDGNCPEMKKGMGFQPRLLTLMGCKNVLLEGITLTNSPNYHATLACDNLEVKGVKFIARPKTPGAAGIGLSGKHVRITNCVFEAGDDNIAIGSTKYAAEDIIIDKCRFGVGHGMSIGSYFQPGVKNVTIRNCTFEGTTAGLRIKSARDRGGVCENITMTDCTMTNVATPIVVSSYYGIKLKDIDPNEKPQPVKPLTPLFRNITIANVVATGAHFAGEILGLPEQPVSGVVLRHVLISSKEGMHIMHAKGVTFVESDITTVKGPKMVQHDATIQGAPPEVSEAK